nr:MAG TPA: hypothetical protein [Caudoviricetes sp.]
MSNRLYKCPFYKVFSVSLTYALYIVLFSFTTFCRTMQHEMQHKKKQQR